VIDEERLVERAEATGGAALALLARRGAALPGVKEVRGLGLMLGVECDGPERAGRAVARALRRGLLLLPSGEDGRVLSITPPLTIEREVLLGALEELCACLA
jgi:4-aminobutyrate aminotransferase-like enzyme